MTQIAGCIAVAGVTVSELPKAGTRQERARPTDAELQRLPTEQEITLLIRALEPVELQGGQGRAIRAAVEGTELSPERLAVLVGDATALLAELHARDTAERLRTTGISRDARASAETAVTAVRSCARARFAQRGGDPAFAESVQIVERNRAALERVLLGGLTPRPRPPQEPQR
jgi:hypothetical protein